MAHKASKPRMLSSPVVVGCGQRASSHVAQVLDYRADYWGDLWLEASTHQDPFWDLLQSPPALPELRPCDITHAAKSFPDCTDVRDGIHPRHFAFLSHESLVALCRLSLAIETASVMPSAVSEVHMAILPKPAGGERTIGLLRSFVRVWARARKSLVQSWESSCASDSFFSSAKGRSAADAVWRRAVRAEAASASAKTFVAILGDLRKCYDHVALDQLTLKASATSFPLAICRLSVQIHSWARRLTMQGAFSRLIYPSRSIVAGAGFATSELKSMVRDMLRRVSSVHRSVTCGIR